MDHLPSEAMPLNVAKFVVKSENWVFTINHVHTFIP